MELFARSKEERDRIAVASNQGAPAEILALLANDLSAEVRATVAENPAVPPGAQVILSRDPNEDVRRNLAANAGLSAEVASIMENDREEGVRYALASNAATCEAVLTRFADSSDLTLLDWLARNPACTVSIVAKIANNQLCRDASGEDDPIEAIAAHPNISAETVEALYEFASSHLKGQPVDAPALAPEGGALTGRTLLDGIYILGDFDLQDIVRACGYFRNGKERYGKFYQTLMGALRLDSLDFNSGTVKKFLFLHEGGSAPILENGVITGRHELAISSKAESRQWDEESWSEEGGDYGMESPFENREFDGSSSSTDNYYNYDTALERFDNPSPDLLRRAYRQLSEDEFGQSVELFLAKHGEHPFEILDIARELNSGK
jgi:hypothetical protein